MSVHEKIRLIRESKGLTQEQIAEQLNMSVNGYGDIERGVSDIKLSKLQKVSELLDIKLSELFELNEKGILNIAYKKNTTNWYIGTSATELEKQLIISEAQSKEITYLKEIIELMKNSK